MQNSKFPLLKPINTIVLSSGHGQDKGFPFDPGVVFDKTREYDQNIFITDIVAQELRNKGLDNVVVPHNLGLRDGRAWVLANHPKAVTFDLHRDSANGLTWEDASTRMGVYSSNEDDTQAIAGEMAKILRKLTKNKNTWSRKEQVIGGLLMASRQPLSFIIEHGFIQGDRSHDHLRRLALYSAQAIYEVFTGNKWEDSNTIINSQNNNNMSQDNISKQFVIDDIKKWTDLDPVYSPQEKHNIFVSADAFDLKSVLEHAGSNARRERNEALKALEEANNKIKQLEADLAKAKETFSLHKFGIDLSKNATLQVVLGILITTGTGYLVARIPELAPYQAEIIAGLASIFGITIAGKIGNNTIKEIKK